MEPNLDPVLDDLFDRYADDVYRYLRVRLPAADAEEVAQDVFMVAWRRAEDVPDNAIAWLLGVARKLAANRRRALIHREAVAAQYEARAETFFPDHSDAIGEADIATRALRRLAEADKEIIQLLVVRDMTNQQIAAALDISVNAAAVRVHRARARLKAAFETEDAEARRADTAGWGPAYATEISRSEGGH